MLRFAQSLGDCFNKLFVAGAEAFLNKCRETAEEVYSAGNSRHFKRFCKLYSVPVIAGGEYHCRGGYGNSFVYDGNPELFFYLFTGCNKILCIAGYLVINSHTHGVNVAVAAVEQGDAHGYGSDIKMFVLNHCDCFKDVSCVKHCGHLA